MTLRKPWLLVSFFIVGLIVAGIWWQTQAASIPAYTGYARLDGPISLELSASPAVVTPGDNVTLFVRLTNNTGTTATPAISLYLPASLHLQTAVLPMGATFNIQTRVLTWLPVFAADEGVQEITLPLRVETADLQQPEQMVTAVLQTHHETAVAETASTQLEMPIWIGIAPQINSVTDLVQVPLGQPVQLQANISGSGPVSQVWYLGDGRRVEVNDPTVAYSLAGVYQITLEVTNPLQTVSRTHILTVVPHPSAQFVADDWSVGVGQPVTFLNQSGGQSPLSYSWDFGDGQTSDQPSPTHSYTLPGTYQVHMTIRNDFGEAEAFGMVTVGMPPQADMSLADSVPAGQPLYGQAFGDDSVTGYVWEMGDGRIYEGPSVTHSYRQMGDFYVLLTALNEFGNTQVGRWVHVDPGVLLTYLPLVLRENVVGETAVEDVLAGLDLEPVELSEPFVMEPVDLPANLTQAEQLYYYINLARQQFDLPPLNQVYTLNIAAQQHTDDMSIFAYTAHMGADGSYPAERLLTAGYAQGYAGEATAWGFEHPYEAVEFWVNSPAHRRIILNRFATDVGVGYTVNFTAPNVWYWTAEFGDTYGVPLSPVVRLQESTIMSPTVTTPVEYRWNWPLPLQSGQEFVLYFYQGRQAVRMASATQPALGSLYALPFAAYDVAVEPGEYQWQIKLQQGQTVLAESALSSIVLLPDLNLPTPTPEVTATVPAPTVTPTPTTPSGPIWPTETPRPTLPPPPVFPTATPAP
ncbi:MAG: PKD domain-containing protein [Anaerolineales bacterium]|nr:PKD domain-containing protein [Anaerolineales bacterium]